MRFRRQLKFCQWKLRVVRRTSVAVERLSPRLSLEAAKSLVNRSEGSGLFLVWTSIRLRYNTSIVLLDGTWGLWRGLWRRQGRRGPWPLDLPPEAHCVHESLYPGKISWFLAKMAVRSHFQSYDMTAAPFAANALIGSHGKRLRLGIYFFLWFAPGALESVFFC